MAKSPAARTPRTKTPDQPAPSKDAGFVAPRKRTDWDAVERDYRTGKFTLREINIKHGADPGQISRKAKKDGWTQDLGEAIRHATNARLVADLVDKDVKETQQKVNIVVLAAAEQNARVIQGHRTRLASLTDAVEIAQAKLLSMGDTLADVRDAATFVQAVGNLATATKTLIEQERKAHRLDDDADTARPPKRITLDFVDVVAR